MNKFIICSLLIVLAFCQEETSRISQIQSFVEGVAKTLNITVSDQISNCFEDHQVDLVWDMLQSTSQYTRAIRDGQWNGWMVTAVRLWGVSMRMVKGLECVGKTKDWMSIIKALGIKETNPCEIDKLTMLFLDSYPTIVSPILENMSNHIERKSFEEAGNILGRGMMELNKNEYDEKTMRVTSFINGIFLRNGVPVPDSMRGRCWDSSEKDSDAIHILRFYKDWASSLEDTKSNQVWRETMKYFLEDGLKHYEAVGSEVWQCIRGSSDNEKFRHITGYNLDPYDAAFDFDFGNFLSCDKNLRRYTKLMMNVRTLLEKKTKFYLVAGLNYGTLLWEVSEWGIN